MKTITSKRTHFYGFGIYVAHDDPDSANELLEYTVCLQFWGWTVWFTW